METTMRLDTLARPYTVNSFQNKINQFHSLMKEITLHDLEATPEERRQIIADSLRFDEFCVRLTDLFGEDIQVKDMKNLYRKISANPDAEVDWCELFGYHHSGLVDDDIAAAATTPAGDEGTAVFAISFRTRAGNVSMDRRRMDTTRSIRYCKYLDSYIIASKKGIVTLWNMKLDNADYFEMPGTSWLVDCVFLPNFRKLLCCTERGLIIWDPRSNLKHSELCIIKSFENAFISMAYIPTTDLHYETILIGDDQGYVSKVTLSALDLLHKHATSVKKIPESNQTIINLTSRKLTIPIKKRRVHTGWVLKLSWIEELKSVASCCASDRQSFVMDNLENFFNHEIKLKAAHIYRGVNAFIYSTFSGIAATGGPDKIIRTWHPAVLTKPTGKLIGHLFTIVDLQINEKDQHLISLSSARVVRVWCLDTMTNLQIFTDRGDRAGEKRIQTMFYDQKYERLLTGSGVIDCWMLLRTVQESMVVPQSHNRSIVQMLYNAPLNQFVSVCSEPVIRVWCGETGDLLYQLLSPHGANIEVVSMSTSTSGYRLVTGATNGTIKVWDAGAGQKLKCHQVSALRTAAHVGEEEEASDAAALCSLLYLPHHSSDHRRLIVTAGWDRAIRLYSDSDEDSDLVLLVTLDDRYNDITTNYYPFTLTSTLNTHRKLPPIGLTINTTHSQSSILSTEQISCTGVLQDFGEQAVLLVGTHSGSIILWDTKSTNITNIFRVPEMSGGVHQEILNSLPSKRVHAVGALRYTKAANPELSNSYEGSYEDSPSIKKSSDYTGEGRVRAITEGPDEGRVRAITEGPDEGRVRAITESPADTNNLIRGKFQPVIISLHEDAGIRLWTVEGHLLCEAVAQTRRTGVPVTCYGTDTQCKVLVTGDELGYITLWKVSELLEGISDNIEQVVSWRAHTKKVTSVIAKLHKQKFLIYSSSADGSVRIWLDRTCRHLGYLGQGRPIVIPSSLSHVNGTQALPCDIHEQPLHSPNKRRKPENQRNKNPEVPLVSNRDRKSDILSSPSARTHMGTKFFRSLSKPKQYNDHLEHVREVVDAKDSISSGFVFRTLPVYKITTPKRINHPGSLFYSLPRPSIPNLPATIRRVRH